MDYVGTSSYNVWSGISFELVALNNVASIKKAGGFFDVASKEYAWVSKGDSVGAHIDLAIERKDGVILILEAKYQREEFVFDVEEEERLSRKISVFREETGAKEAIKGMYLTLNGLRKTNKAELAISSIAATQLFD